MKWFDRTFAFDIPIWMYPNIVERLRGTPVRLEALTKDVPSKRMIRKDGSNWSAQEHVGHLLDLEPLWIGRVEEILSGKPVLRSADLLNMKTHEAEHNSRPLQAILDEFHRTRLPWVRRLDKFDEGTIAKSALHPRLEQPMRLIDLLFFVAEHDDHHLAHITRLKRAV